MTSREFCYWLQGYFEINEAYPSQASSMTGSQAETVKRHLAMVFAHEIDPSYPDGANLDKIHDPTGLGDNRPRC